MARRLIGLDPVAIHHNAIAAICQPLRAYAARQTGRAFRGADFGGWPSDAVRGCTVQDDDEDDDDDEDEDEDDEVCSICSRSGHA